MRKILIASVLTLLSLASWLHAELVTRRVSDPEHEIMGHGLRVYVDTFKANERAVALASGNGDSCLALYVFDTDGNCVAADDRSDPATGDDCGVEWIPTVQAKYSVEARNLGSRKNEFRIRLR
ncbi:MAG: hypothetical protein EXS16_22085 [Gemmataceae bacterium]|nr:hypothetical protein [Gemmataceae bacterium]